jgi:hypothetical protein
MVFDITKLSEDELLELNRRIVERLQFIRSAKSLAQLARFSVGMAVEFDTDDGRTISGTVARLNQKTATVVRATGRWRVSPSSLWPASVTHESPAASRIVAMPRRRWSSLLAARPAPAGEQRRSNREESRCRLIRAIPHRGRQTQSW